MIARVAFLWLVVALAARGETTLTLADIPSKYVCLVFTFEFDTINLSKSVGRHEVYAVEGERWRLEALSEIEKGFVATFDGEKLRSTSRKIDGNTPEHVSDSADFVVPEAIQPSKEGTNPSNEEEQPRGNDL